MGFGAIHRWGVHRVIGLLLGFVFRTVAFIVAVLFPEVSMPAAEVVKTTGKPASIFKHQLHINREVIGTDIR